MSVVSLDLKSVRDQLSIIFKSDMHLKRQHSLADAAFGLLNSETLRLHALGEGLAFAKGLDKKHATKQIDRLLSNKKLKIWDIAENWVPYIIVGLWIKCSPPRLASCPVKKIQKG